MSEQDYLKEFGRMVLEVGYSTPIKEVSEYIYNPPKSNISIDEFLDKFTSLINKATDEEKEAVVLMCESILESSLFNILKIFDEEKKYKLMCLIGDKEYNLQEIAEDNDYGNGYLYGEIFNWLDDLKDK